jgi:predicted amidohydrolase
VGIHELPTREKDGEAVTRDSEAGRKVFNSFVAIQPTGEVAETYRKVSPRLHLRIQASEMAHR